MGRGVKTLRNDRRGSRGVLLTLEKPGGAPFTITVAPADPRVKTEAVAEGLHVAPPLFLSRPGEYYWYQYLSDSQTLYIQYNACANDPKLSFSGFAKQTLTEADAHPVKRVVIDLRQNGGGDSRVIGPLKSGLAARLQAIGHVYVLIGPLTFSSAVDNASELRHSLHATLVGEQAGETPGGYGEVKFLTLPNSRLSCSIRPSSPSQGRRVMRSRRTWRRHASSRTLWPVATRRSKRPLPRGNRSITADELSLP